MTDLFSNGEKLSSVRAKISAATVPYASKSEFEGASIPASVRVVSVIINGECYRCYRDDAGTWVSGDGGMWIAFQQRNVSVTEFTDAALFDAYTPGDLEFAVLYDA